MIKAIHLPNFSRDKHVAYWHHLLTAISLFRRAIALLLLNVTLAVSQDHIPQIDAALQQQVDSGEIAGAVTLVAERGIVAHLGAVGWADLANRRPMQSDTLFGIMSMTKPITATGLMMLVDEGKLTLDDPVEKFIPAFADARLGNGDRVRGLTIRRLLEHTSGLVGEQFCEGSLQATAAMLAKRPFAFQPGMKWSYGPGITVCGRIIEIVSGEPYEQFLNEQIFRPLDMVDTTFHVSSEQVDRVASLYKFNASENKLVPADRWPGAGLPDATPNPSAGLFSTATDLFRFYQMVLNCGEMDGHRLISADSVRQMVTVQTGDLPTAFTPGNGWGLGWYVIRKPQGVTRMLSPGTFGHGGGFCTGSRIDPVKQRIYVLLIQRADVDNIDGSEIVHRFQQAASDALDQ